MRAHETVHRGRPQAAARVSEWCREPDEDEGVFLNDSRTERGAALIELSEIRNPPPSPVVSFDRRELSEILRVYGRMVSAGEWRDYAIDTLKDRAIFSIFRRSSEMPLFRVEKNPKLARRQGAYAVIATGGQVLKRGHELPAVLRVFDKGLRLV